MTRFVLSAALWSLAACELHAGEPSPDLLRTVARIVTDRSVFDISQETVQQRFAALAPLEATAATKQNLRFLGDRIDKGVAWVLVDFQPSSEKPQRWTFLQLQICLRASKGTETAIRSELARRLGSPKTEDGRASWQLGRYKELSVRSGSFEPPRAAPAVQGVLFEVVLLQGEPE